MRKLFTTLMGLTATATLAVAQVCTPNPNAIDIGDPGEIWPPEFDVAYTCTSSYSQTVTAIVPPSLQILPGVFATVVDYTINTVTGLPPGFSFACNPGSCVYPASTSGCVVLTGNPSGVAPGTYNIIGDLTVTAILPPFLGGTTIMVDTLYPFELLVDGCKNCASSPLSAQAPANPRSLNLPTSGRYQLKWGPVLGAVGYQVNGGPIPALGAVSPQLGQFNTTFLVPYAQLVPGATYRWGVRAGCGPSGPPLTPLSVFDTFASPTARLAEMTEAINEVRSLDLYPNPATDLVVLEYNSNLDGDAIVRVFDVTGRVVMTERATVYAGPNVIRYDLDLTPGLYIMEMEQGDEKISAKFTVTE
jgi:hypothetical protein